MTAPILLTQGYVTLVDDADRDAVMAAGPWMVCGRQKYAAHRVRRPEGPTLRYLHAFLTGWPLVDHIDGDPRNNRRSNLRPATPSQNAANARRRSTNRSGFKGVSWDKGVGKWFAKVTVNRKQIYLGIYHDVEDAARAYDDAARYHFGEFAAVNFPRPGERSCHGGVR